SRRGRLVRSRPPEAHRRRSPARRAARSGAGHGDVPFPRHGRSHAHGRRLARHRARGSGGPVGGWHPARMQPELAIRLRGVVKRYGPITAVDGLDLEVPMGTCVGLLGPNGAGKSTTMRLLTAQSIADDGELEVLGHRLPRDSKAARAECGVVPQLDNLDVTLTVEQNLLVFAHLYRIPRHERREAIERALDIANLVHPRVDRIATLSRGM